MITQTCKGGEFYAESTRRDRAIHAKRWNSLIKQLWSVAIYSSMLIGVAARVVVRPSIFFAPNRPRVVRFLTNESIETSPIEKAV